MVVAVEEEEEAEVGQAVAMQRGQRLSRLPSVDPPRGVCGRAASSYAKISCKTTNGKTMHDGSIGQNLSLRIRTTTCIAPFRHSVGHGKLGL